MVFEGVVFDWDETLAATKDVAVLSFKNALECFDIDVSAGFIKKQMGKSARNILIDILEESKTDFDDKLLDCLLDKRVESEIELSDQVSLYDGAVDLLDSLFGKVTLGVATMNDKAVIEHMLESKKLRGYFDIVLSADDVKKSKPDPQIFLCFAGKMKILPKNCVVLEDSIFGVKAAKAAGMSCVGVASGSYSKEELQRGGSDVVVDCLLEKKKILDFVFQK
ncbi:MAG: HAD family phosphatase [Candidatus Bathyarchaeota archaeon]